MTCSASGTTSRIIRRSASSVPRFGSSSASMYASTSSTTAANDTERWHDERQMQLFHYHLVTSRVREVEARYVGKLGFDLVARHGRIGEDLTSFEPGVSWEELDAKGFKLRLSELELGSVNVVVQPGQWPLPRVDHLGLALDEDEFESALQRADDAELRVQEHGGRRTFISTNAGYRLELHPPRDWIDELLEESDRLRLSELHLKADDPEAKARALEEVLGGERIGGDIE